MSVWSTKLEFETVCLEPAMRDNFNLNLKEAADQMTEGWLLSLKVPPGVWRRELVHIARLIMRFVPQVESQLVPQTYFFLKHKK